jgi:uncharacterized protein (TIGR00730 family)
MTASTGPKAVAVFGSSEPREGEPLYQEAREVGALLAKSGFVVVNGGYGGVMEAASRGAREAGGRAVGVTTSAFRRGPGNPYLDEEHREADLFSRTRRLIQLSHAYIILRGKSGTLAELAFLWALDRGGLLPPTRIALLGDCWKGVLGALEEWQMVEPTQLGFTRLARTPVEAVEIVTTFLR